MADQCIHNTMFFLSIKSPFQGDDSMVSRYYPEFKKWHIAILKANQDRDRFLFSFNGIAFDASFEKDEDLAKINEFTSYLD